MKETKLEMFLERLVKAIADTPGLPLDWQENRLEELREIFDAGF